MRKILLLSITVSLSITVFSQDFSNKGKDFWVGYGYHERMVGGGNSPARVAIIGRKRRNNRNNVKNNPNVPMKVIMSTGVGLK